MTDDFIEPEPAKKGFAAVIAALKGMLSFFTLIRLDVGMDEFEAMERNFWLAPIIGVLNGLVAFIVCVILGRLDFGLLVCSAAALLSMYLFSKFLHFDGLTDFGDGMIVSSGKREDHVRALKDSLIGAGGFGVTLTVVLLTVVFYNQIGSTLSASAEQYFLPLAMVALSVEILIKNSMVAAAAFGMPSNGMAARQVRCTSLGSLAKSTILTVVLLLVINIVMFHVVSEPMYPFRNVFETLRGTGYLISFVLAVVTSVLVGYVMARKANKTFGFVNGDILGATNEVSRCVILLVISAALGLML
ncbi:MAG: adenosylcobinamide-GDP ribazoletransferase [archaeon]|nr:adenosylcobinamide-GDP ribazoletransferase [archaeon]